ncbi:TetR family transcriptional regulator [Burkholderia metallica]|uniref:TetR family transcriptional regulator n=1 Tax=Burkholderia metallica TaxID=488729 RepID=UPI00157B95BD|nr:TetR family transcriptional regulator [Burkholderia metallica]NTZ84231.1 TetR family transcriptional regulator [Burkholderia metallica]
MARKTKEAALLTREAILDASERLFDACGRGAASLEDIAEAAGVTRGAVYWHFKDKSDLLLALFVRVRESFRDQLLALARRGSRRGSIKAFCRLLLSGGARRAEAKAICRPGGKLLPYDEIFLAEPLTAHLAIDLFQEMHETLVAILNKPGDAGENGAKASAGETEIDAYFLQALLVGHARLCAFHAAPRKMGDAAARIVGRGIEAVSARHGARARAANRVGATPIA